MKDSPFRRWILGLSDILGFLGPIVSVRFGFTKAIELAEDFISLHKPGEISPESVVKFLKDWNGDD